MLKSGTRLCSVVCDTQVVVVRGAEGDVDLRCGGLPMGELDSPRQASGPVAPFDGGTKLGKRYVEENSEIELLCTKPGAGSLSIGDRLLGIKDAKPLPASD